MDADVAAQKLNVRREVVLDWEEGRRPPSVPQLRNAARVYKRPLAVFFMTEPPPTPQQPHDFRRFPDLPPPTLSPGLAFAMRRGRRRRQVALELLDDVGMALQPFTLRTSELEDPEVVGLRMREWLGVSMDDQRRWRGDHAALNGWIAALEARDVLVFQAKGIPLDQMRGFSLSEPVLPVIVLNSSDLPRAKAFTLMHEFTHLALNISGVCEPLRARSRPRTRDEAIEVFCNHAAGAALVPREALLAHPLVRRTPVHHAWVESAIVELAAAFSVSREVVLRRLLILDRITERFYDQKRREYLAQYHRMARERAESEEGGHVPYHVLVLRDNGRRYTQAVLDAFERDRIAPGDVADYLGLRLNHLDDLVGAVRRRRAET